MIPSDGVYLSGCHVSDSLRNVVLISCLVVCRDGPIASRESMSDALVQEGVELLVDVGLA
jgi:hypothetical protein